MNNKVNYIKPHVIVMDHHDTRLRSWELSRPNTLVKKLSDIDGNGDLGGLHDLNTVDIRFTSSAGFREVLLNLQPSAKWTMSSRNQSIEQIGLNDDAPTICSIGDRTIRDRLRVMYYDSVDAIKELGHDAGRLNMPLSYMSSFDIRLPVRTLISLWKWFDEYDLSYYRDTYLTPVFEQTFIIDGYEQLHDLMYSYWKSYKPHIKSFEINDDWKEGYVHFNDIIIVSSKMCIAHRAQFVRQSTVKLTDNIFETLKNLKEFEFECLPLSHELNTTIILNKYVYDKIASKRGCFIADNNLWSSFIISSVNRIGFPQILPCGGCKDKCTIEVEAKDCSSRLAKTLPCPIYDHDLKWFNERFRQFPDCEYYKIVDKYFNSIEYLGADGIAQV